MVFLDIFGGLLCLVLTTVVLMTAARPEDMGRLAGRISKGWREEVGFGWRP